jgi:glycosyltransferase involved in cell wall biosynthesis
MKKLSVAIITFNEEKNIGGCIESCINVADEILILDSHSTDETRAIANSYDKVRFETRDFDGHIEQKNAAIALCSHEWILSLDADERVSQELEKQLLRFKSEGDTTAEGSQSYINGYRLARLTFHMGRYIAHSGWYPLRRYRLFRKGFARWAGENPHDYVEIDGRGSKLKGDIIHYSFKDLSHQVDTVNRFSSIVAFTRFRKGRRFRWLPAIYKPWGKFWEIYLFKRGFLDGFPGFCIAVASSFSTFLKFAKIYELDRKFIARPSNVRLSYGEKETSEPPLEFPRSSSKGGKA